MGKYAVVSAGGNSLYERINIIERYAVKAKENGCSAIAFPECFITGYSVENASELAVDSNDTMLNRIAESAKKLSIDILCGFIECEGDKLYISYGIWLSSGKKYVYRKTHLGTREETVFSAGDNLAVFTLSDGMPIGIQLCVETHYTEITQTLSLRGAKLIFAPHAVPLAAGSRKGIWERYIPARAYDNKVTLACCNLYDGSRYGGGCLAVSPKGEIIAEDYNGESMVVFEADPFVDRSKHYFPARRKKELYE